MKSTDVVGIVGLGDLGGRMTLQVESAGLEVVAYEPYIPKIPRLAVDPKTVTTGLMWPPKQAESVEAVFDEAKIIHWCAPSTSLPEVELSDNQTLVLHDSVMHSSRANMHRVKGLGAVGVVHCLMNNFGRVNVASDLSRHEYVAEHMTSLGLDVTTKSIDEHDRLMAHSQASLAYGVLFDLELIKRADPADFTPSGREYDDAITNRAAQWTLATLRTIFQNPHILKQDRIRALARIEELQNLGYTTVNG